MMRCCPYLTAELRLQKGHMMRCCPCLTGGVEALEGTHDEVFSLFNWRSVTRR